MPAGTARIARDSRWTRAVARLGGTWALSSPRRTARLLYGFSGTEEQSQLELRQAAALCGDEHRRALYLRHALDEARHAQVFAQHAAALEAESGSPELSRPAACLEDLFDGLGEIRFLAFVYRGERRGRTEFEEYQKLLERRGQHDLARLFGELARDERHHEAYTWGLLRELCDERERRRVLAWSARREAWLAFRRHGRRVGALLYGLSVLVVYGLLAPYALLWRLFAKERRGFSSET
jgi:rubrerythrin